MSFWYGRWLARLLLVATTALFIGDGTAFSMQRNDNIAIYWGQDGAGSQQSLGFYCNDPAINTIPLAFLFTFFGQGGQPVIDFSNVCGQGGKSFPGTGLADCSFMASDIQKCQANGKLITLSLGGATANVGFNSASQAASFANTIWNMFLGGKGSMRPFGSAVLDGVDLDIENGSAAHYDAFVNTLRSLANGASKRYYVTAAPQCPFPDAKVGEALNSAPFDAVYVQFYNNFCETSVQSEFNFATWDNWAKTQSANKNVKVYLGAPASAQAAGSGFVSSNTLISVAKDAQKRFSSFGGVMLWDVDSSYANGQYHRVVKNAITNGSPSPPSTPNPNPNPNPAPPAPSPSPSNPAPIPSPPSPPKPTTSSFRPNPTPVSKPPTPASTQTAVSTSATESASSTGDPRATGRVHRPNFTFMEQEANPEPTQQPNTLLPSRFFKF